MAAATSIPDPCQVCGKVGSMGRGSLKFHVKFAHKLSPQDYYDRFHRQEGDGECQWCGQPTEWSDHQFRYLFYCCKACRAHDGWQNDQRRQECSARTTTRNNLNWADPEYQERMRQVAIARNADPTNDFQGGHVPGPEARVRLAGLMSERMLAIGDRLSDLATQRVLDPTNKFGTGWGKWGTYQGIQMRSSWERRFAADLDGLNISWAYESRTFRVLDGKRYTPDFYLDLFDLHVEIRPAARVDDRILTRIAAVREQGTLIYLVTQDNWTAFLDSLSPMPRKEAING